MMRESCCGCKQIKFTPSGRTVYDQYGCGHADGEYRCQKSGKIIPGVFSDSEGVSGSLIRPEWCEGHEV